MAKYCYVYVFRSLRDKQFYVGLTRNLSARLQAHNNGLVTSTKKRTPFELVYWEGCRDESDAANEFQTTSRDFARDGYLATTSFRISAGSSLILFST